MAGFTQDETFLHALARRSFLRFWSWPNLFRDQGDSKKGGDGKEICDLVIVFGDDIVLFSDKRIKFSKEKPRDVAWSRWARKAIGESLVQVSGAKRWLQEYPNRVFLDSHCTQRLPITLPPMSCARFHSIVVCHGLEETLQEIHGEPSFSFDTALQLESSWSNSEAVPFTLGTLSNEGFVHVFNEATVELVLKEFDTIKDFLSYLQERKVVLSWPKPLRIESETDIVQMFYESFDEQSNARSIATARELKVDTELISKGGIRKLYENQSYLAKQRANVIANFWDDLIESFAFHILNGTSEFKTWQFPHEIEPGLRLLAQTNRFERRVLSTAFIEFYNKAQPGQRGTRVFLNPIEPKTGYLFFLLPKIASPQNDEKYRKMRREMLEDYCAMAKLDNSELQCVIGIAGMTRETNSPLNSNFFSEGQDFVAYDASQWDEENRKYAEELQKGYISAGLLVSRQKFEDKATEFPEVKEFAWGSLPRDALKGSERNKLCRCGSGIKSKKCCGRPN